MSGIAIKPTALHAWHALCGALDQLDAEGRPTFCRTDPAPFTSDEHEQRAEAVTACGACPAAAACRRFADDNAEPAHVWGGIDRSPRTYTRKAVA